MAPIALRRARASHPLRRTASVPAAVLVAAAILAGACSSTRIISQYGPPRRLGRSTIFLRSGARIAAASVTTSGDTVVVRDHHTRREIRLPFALVERASTRAWFRGFLPGMARGALTGGALGVAVGAMAGSDDPNGSLSDPFSSAIILGGLGFFLGAPVGGLLGVVQGQAACYFVHAPPAAPGKVLAWSSPSAPSRHSRSR